MFDLYFYLSLVLIAIIGVLSWIMYRQFEKHRGYKTAAGLVRQYIEIQDITMMRDIARPTCSDES